MTTRTRETRPEPTVRPPRTRAAARMGRAAVLPFIIGVFAAAIGVALHRYALAAAAVGIGSAIATPFLLAAAVMQARQMRLNPWPFILTAELLAGLAIWLILPFIGLGSARYLLLALACWRAWRGRRRWIRYRRRSAAYRRWAQALSSVLSQSSGQQEQVLAGLAGTAHAERVTAPHYGAAPNAAWSLTITRWDGDQVAQFRLRLPAHDDIGLPDFLARIKDALDRKVGAKHIRLHVDSLRDEITGDVTDGSEDQADPATLKERAEERVQVTAGMLLKGVKVRQLDVDDDAEVPGAGDGIAGAGHAIREVTITYDPTKLVTLEDSRDKIAQHMSTQLTGQPGKLRAYWRVDQETVTFQRRREFPALIPAPRLTPDQLRDLYGDRQVLVCADDEDANYIGYALSKTTLPHACVIGPTGGGKTQLLLLLAIRAAQLGVEVWGADPKMIELMGLRGWPNVTKIATRIQDIVNLIDAAHAEMYRRINDVAAGRKRRSDLRRLLVIIDEYFVFRMLLNTWWAGERTKEDPKEHPAVGQIAELLALCRGLNMNMVLGVQRPDAVLFADGARDNIGWWASLGSLSPQGAQMAWGDYHTGTDLPPDEPGLATMTTAAGPGRGKVHFVPNPADALVGDGLTDADMEFLRTLLPPGTTWDGPLPAEAPDPGFEDSAAAREAIAGDPVEAFLLLLRLALGSRTAHLTAAPGGGQPGGESARYGWGPGPGGLPEPGGTFIGSVEQTKSGRRVYLYPEHAYDVAARFAAELTESFDLDRGQLDHAMRNSGLLATEGPKDEPRYTVRRNLPDSGLPGDPRKRVWDIPEEALLGGGPAPAARPAEPVRREADSKRAADQPAMAPLAPARFRRAGDLADTNRIVLVFDDGEELAATVFGSPEDDPTTSGHPEPDGVPRIVLNYVDDNNVPGWVRARIDHPIRLEQHGTTEGSQP